MKDSYKHTSNLWGDNCARSQREFQVGIRQGLGHDNNSTGGCVTPSGRMPFPIHARWKVLLRERDRENYSIRIPLRLHLAVSSEDPAPSSCTPHLHPATSCSSLLPSTPPLKGGIHTSPRLSPEPSAQLESSAQGRSASKAPSSRSVVLKFNILQR